MKVSNTSERLKLLIKERNLKQRDILVSAEPFCQKYDVKLNKNDLSQYVSGKVEPKQSKLSILGLALNVSEAWLMGYDVPREKLVIEDTIQVTSHEKKLIEEYRKHPELHKAIDKMLDL